MLANQEPDKCIWLERTNSQTNHLSCSILVGKFLPTLSTSPLIREEGSCSQTAVYYADLYLAPTEK